MDEKIEGKLRIFSANLTCIVSCGTDRNPERFYNEIINFPGIYIV